MKLLLLAVSTILLAGPAQAATKTLVCTGGPRYEEFRATLDDSAFDGSGFFHVKNASVIDNYASARLICTGHRLHEISCVGFWFGQGNHVVQVTTGLDRNGLFAVHRNLTPSPVSDSARWGCELR